MVNWGSIRIPHFTSEDRRNGQNELRTDLLFGQSPRLKAFTCVKRNPFPASFLKSKAQEPPTSSSAASRSCGVQLHDLIRRTSNRTLSYTPFQAYGALRRSRSERKEDWDMAMSWLMDGQDIPPKDEMHETRKAIQCPILETILLEEDGAPTICFTDVPVMLLIPSAAKSSVLSVESNMCFDVEFLINVCKGQIGAQTHQHPGESLDSVGIHRILGQNPSKKLLDPSLTQEQNKAPIVSISALRNPGLLKRSIQECLQSSILSVHDKLNPGGNSVSTHDISNESMDMTQLNYLRRFQVAFLRNISLANDELRSVSENTFLSSATCRDNLLRDYLSCKINVGQRNCSANTIHGPIFETKVLAIDLGGNESKSILTELARLQGRPKICSNNLFQSMTEFCRNSFMSERCLWSRGAKDVMSRARYKRKRLLLPQTRTLPLIFSSGQCLTKIQTSSQKDMNHEELDSLVFSPLRAISVHNERNKSQTSQLLDSLDFVPEHVAKRRREFLTTCHRAVLKKVYKFDPPVRKWSKVHVEKIQSRYEGSRERSTLSKERKNQTQGAAEVIDVDSDESVLEDLLLSDEDTEEQTMDANAFGMLEEIRADLRHCDQRKPTGSHKNTNEGPRVGKGSCRVEIRKKPKVRLKVPDGLVCAPWVIQVANQCVQTMERGSIFVPPPLSALPVIAVLTNTHLKHNVRDQRVVIVCESDTNVTDYIREYLQQSLGESVSIDTINKAEHDSVDGIASLPHTIARVVILDSFAFSSSIPFSLLVVFITTPTHAFSSRSQIRGRVFESNCSWWSRIPAVILAPLDAGLQPSSKRIRSISQELRAKDVLWVKATDVVFDSVTISTPKVVYLAPSNQVARILVLLDSHAKPCLETYLNLKNIGTAPNMAETSGLKFVKLRFLKEVMRDAPTGDTAGKHQSLELLYILRQARSYATFDGFDIAVAYLHHCCKQSNRHVGIVKKILQRLNEENGNETAQTRHPILTPLDKVLKDMKHSMLQDPPSLRSIHRRDSFRPLVVANSQETVDACLRGLQDAALLPDATEANIAVYPLERFRTTSKKLGKHDLREKLEAFSHVFHVIDDRYDVPSDLLLPPSLLQQVHAGRTRLVTIIVDDIRELDERCELEKVWYHKLTKMLEKEELGEIECKAPYLQQVSLESFWSAARNLLPNCVDDVSEQIQTSIPQGQVVSSAHRIDTPAKSSETLHLPPNEICAFTVQGLRAMLVGRLESLSGLSSRLEIDFHVRPDESCSPAATYLHSAIAGNERLRKNVSIRTTFSF